MANADLLLEQEGPGPGYAAGAGRHEHAEEPPRVAVVAADRGAALRHVSDIAHVQVPVGAEHHDQRPSQPAAVARDERIHELPSDTVVTEYTSIRERDTKEIA